MKVKKVILSLGFKEIIISYLLWAGIFFCIRDFWQLLETIFDNGIEESISDTVIAVILSILLWYQARSCIIIKNKK